MGQRSGEMIECLVCHRSSSDSLSTTIFARATVPTVLAPIGTTRTGHGIMTSPCTLAPHAKMKRRQVAPLALLLLVGRVVGLRRCKRR